LLTSGLLVRQAHELTADPAGGRKPTTTRPTFSATFSAFGRE
jgi:hypothetical protein